MWGKQLHVAPYFTVCAWLRWQAVSMAEL